MATGWPRLWIDQMATRRIVQILADGQPGESQEVCGWVRTRRDSKAGLSFVELNDGSCLSSLQLVVPGDLDGWDDAVGRVTTGASLRVSGTLKESPGKGQRFDLGVESLEVIGEADAENYPLQKKRHSFEFLREIAHLRPRTNTFGAIARVRNALSAAIHRFFQDRGFVYVHTPIITTSDCEGAGEMFQVTTLNLQRLAQVQTEIDYGQDFFGRPASLTVSGQLEAEIYATSVGDCYTFGPTFRAENSNTSRHLAEFWMIEPEMPFYELPDNMELAESFIRSVVGEVLERCNEDMEFFNKWYDDSSIAMLEGIANSKFERITYTEAVKLLQESGENFDYPVSWGIDLQSEHERYLTETKIQRPVIVTDYPKNIKAFYMRMNDDGKTGAAMDVLAPGIGEIIGGSQREERLPFLEKRMKEMSIPEKDLWWYLETRRFGTVPHSGFGLGFERMVMLVTGLRKIFQELFYMQ